MGANIIFVVVIMSQQSFCVEIVCLTRAELTIPPALSLVYNSIIICAEMVGLCTVHDEHDIEYSPSCTPLGAEQDILQLF